jgi:hypothetical protein
MVRRIDSLTPGARVVLNFDNDYEEPAKFLRVEGSGAEREAWFESLGPAGEPYKWAAYRFEGYWVYGSSAQRLRVVEVPDA